MTDEMASVLAESATEIVLVAAIEIGNVIVFDDPAADEEIPPTPNATVLPPSAYPVPWIVIEAKLVFAAKSFVLVWRSATDGNTRSSPATGATPPQLSALVQLLSAPVPVHVFVAAATYGPTNGPPLPSATPAGSRTPIP